MHISIWQQFSSNHSGSFWVVGMFKTVDKARDAYDKFRHILFDIDRWHQEHKAESKAAQEKGTIQPLPPETAIALQYGVDWPSTIDWTGWAEYRMEDHPGYASSFAIWSAQTRSEILIDEAVTIVGRTVVVQNPDQTNMTIQPFEGLLRHLGGETIGYDFDLGESTGWDIEFHTRLTFVAPDTAIASKIEREFRNYLGSDLTSADNLPPWHDDEANFQKVIDTSKLLRREYVEQLQTNWQRRYELHNLPDPSPDGQKMPGERLALRNVDAQITRNDLNFKLENIWFYNDELGVSALIAYLEVNGCTNIDFEYVRKLDDQE